MLHNGAARRLPGVFMIAEHKPVLMFVKGTRRGRTMLPDVLRPARRDKSAHPWGQGDGGIWPIIHHLTSTRSPVLANGARSQRAWVAAGSARTSCAAVPP
jgi:hypothetical protein